jgi:integrase
MKRPPKGSGLYLIKRKNGEQKYQSRIWNPVLKRIGKWVTWDEKDFNKVLQLHYQLKSAYENDQFEIVESIQPKEKPATPHTILQCAAVYEAYLKDDSRYVQSHQVKNLDEEYIKTTIQQLKTFLSVLQFNNIQLSTLSIGAIDDQMVGMFHSQLEKRYQDEEIGAVTYNRYMKTCRYFVSYIAKTYRLNIDNPFERVQPKKQFKDPQILELNELETLLSCITPDNAIGYKGSKKHTVNYYREWLPLYLTVSVFIGGRPGEIARLRWTDVQGEYIIIRNEKVDKKERVTGHKNYIHIHPDLAEVLLQLEPQMKSIDDYILVPEWANRKTLIKFISKAFHHYLTKHSGIDKDVTLYNLRHTYINAIYNMIGEDGLSIHNKKETAIKYYLSKKRRHELQAGKRLFNIDKSLYTIA